jgi:hypothetical protein
MVLHPTAKEKEDATGWRKMWSSPSKAQLDIQQRLKALTLQE